MNKEFEPYDITMSNPEFNAWDYNQIERTQTKVTEVQVDTVSEEERIWQEAKEQGYAAGLQQAQEELEKQKELLAQWLQLIKNPVQLLDDKLTQEMIQTVIWISQHCIGVELSINPDKLRDLFDKIKDELPSLLGDKVLAMHPDDMDWVKQNIHEKEISGLHDILYADPLLNRGDFYLKSQYSELDGRIHTRLLTLFAKYIDEQDNLIPPIETQDAT